MPSLFSANNRQALLARIDKLTPDASPKWGKMTAPQMLAHLSDAKRMVLRELSVTSKWLPLRYPPLKHLVIYLAPFPKGAPTAIELISRPPEAFEVERGHLRALIQRVGGISSDFVFPPHPAFGTLSRRAWGVLGYRHIDHHLRQFGI